jgi:hypothetical protein
MFVGYLSSSQDQQNNIGNDIENKQDDFEEPEERIENHDECFSRDGEPSALGAVDQVLGQYAYGCPKKQQGAIDDRAPHKEPCQRMYVHDEFPFLSCT